MECLPKPASPLRCGACLTSKFSLVAGGKAAGRGEAGSRSRVVEAAVGGTAAAAVAVAAVAAGAVETAAAAAVVVDAAGTAVGVGVAGAGAAGSAIVAVGVGAGGTGAAAVGAVAGAWRFAVINRQGEPSIYRKRKKI